MIDVKYIQLIVDDERSCSGMIVSNDLASIQTHQIPLIDAFIGVTDFKRLPYVIIPAQRPTPAVIFKDTFLLDPSDVETPQTMFISTDAHLLMCLSESSADPSLVMRTRNRNAMQRNN
jgi:hypothetical protein